MHWVEVCSDGIYWVNGEEHTIPVDSIVQIGVTDSQHCANRSAHYSYLFHVETEHGDFSWEVEVVEYLEPAGATMTGFSTTQIPPGIILKDTVTFQLQDGWL